MKTPRSLKAILPTLAPILGVTEAALYERQRALVRKGLLCAPFGRGPGSGQRPTLDAVALLVAAAVISDNLSDIARLDALEIRKVGDNVARAIAKRETFVFRRPAPSRGMAVVVTLPAEASVEILQTIP